MKNYDALLIMAIVASVLFGVVLGQTFVAKDCEHLEAFKFFSHVYDCKMRE